MTNPGGLDPNHNEYFNSESLLEIEYRKAMKQRGVEIPEDTTAGTRASMFETETTEVGDTFFMTGRPGTKKVESEAGREEQMTVAENATGDLVKFAQVVMDAKDRAIGLFEALSSDTRVSSDIESLIHVVERLEEACGIKIKKFEPLRHMSGLRTRDTLDNANRVLDNTRANYDMHLINGMESAMSGTHPAIKIAIVGEQGGKGFVAHVSVVAKKDFGGSESIDYVHASPKGLFSIKRFERNRWIDVSEDFSIKAKVIEHPLERDADMPHSIFVGEKIASQGKDILMKYLNLKEEDVKFGTRQIFAASESVINGVRKAIKSG